MKNPVLAFVPMLTVENVPRSIAFYRLLGFEVKDTFTPSSQDQPSWASLFSGCAQLMVTQNTDPKTPPRATALFYCYCEDVAVLHQELQAAGLQVGPIETPFYAPEGEFRVQDPDGYVLQVTHT